MPQPMGTASDQIRLPWGERTPYGRGERWPERVDEHLEAALDPADVERWVPSASVLHSNGDGIDIAVRDGRIVGVRGASGRSGQPRPARSEGPLRLAGQPRARTG